MLVNATVLWGGLYPPSTRKIPTGADLLLPWHGDDVSGPDLTTELMARVRSSGLDDHLTLLLGAGASTGSGLPNWDALAMRLLVTTGAVANEEAARLLVSHQDPLLVTEAARTRSEKAWNERLREALYPENVDPAPSSLHQAVANYFLAGDSVNTTLMTLNFDTLLEEAIRDGTEREVEARADGIEGGRALTVQHLHGIISHDDVRDAVLTLSDFNVLLGDARSWQREMLRHAANSGALLIAGTSFRDPDLRHWLHLAFAERTTHYAALVLLSREAFELDRSQFDRIRSALEDQWRAVGLEPIVLQDFSDAAQLVRELRHVARDDYQSPQQRASAVWQAHVLQFGTLQQQYSDALLKSAGVLKEVFDVDEINLTLWLSDGVGGRLVRWASQDRTYRSVKDLRSVSSGHDSHWVAGRALGAEDVLIQDLDDVESGRWKSALAVPIRVRYGDHPDMATAVLSVGLPDAAVSYEKNREDWLAMVLDDANTWSTRLIDSVPGRSLDLRARRRGYEMSMSTGSFQEVGSGTYRVSGVRVDPNTGRYILRNGKASARRKKVVVKPPSSSKPAQGRTA